MAHKVKPFYNPYARGGVTPMTREGVSDPVRLSPAGAAEHYANRKSLGKRRSA